MEFIIATEKKKFKKKMKFYFLNDNITYLLIIFILLLQNIKARFVSETNHEQIDRDSQDYFHERGLTFGNPDAMYDQNDLDMENDNTQYFPQQPLYKSSLSIENMQNLGPQLQLEQLPKSGQIGQQIPIQPLEPQLKLQQLFQQQQQQQQTQEQQLQKQYGRELQQPHLHLPQPSNNLFIHQNFDKNEQNLLYNSPKKVLAMLKQNEESNLLHKIPGNMKYHKIYDQKFILNPPLQLQLNQARLQAQQPLIPNQEPKVLINLESDNNKQLCTDMKDNYKMNDINSVYPNPNNFDLEAYGEEKLKPSQSVLYNSYNSQKMKNKIQQPDLSQNNNNINSAEERNFLAKNPNPQL